MKIDFKKWIPILVSILIFVVLSLVYVKPVLEGKKIKQGDIVNHKGMARELVDFREQTGEEALWTNNMFGGMPAYQISTIPKTNLTKYIYNVLTLGLPQPASKIFLYFLGFFILLLVITKNNLWLSVLGAIAFAFSSYFFIIIEAGHNTKSLAIAFMAPVLAGFILTYRGKYLWGMILVTIAMALEVFANHIQITYYLMIALLIYVIIQLVVFIKEKRIKEFIKPSLLMLVAVVIAVGCNMTKLITTYEYTKDSTRGQSELTFDKENKTTGLDKDYATQWSYGIGETFTLMIPNAKGGASGYIADNKKALSKVDPKYKQMVAQTNSYWGEQPFTSGPVYAGAIIVFLFILGLFIVKGPYRWFVLITTLLAVMLAWGSHFSLLTNFFLDYVPGYNKFRAVSTALVLVEFMMPLMAVLGLYQIIKDPEFFKDKKQQRKLYIAFGITGGLSLLFYLMPSTFFNFVTDADYNAFESWKQSAKDATELQQINAYITEIMPQIEIARIAIFKADAIRSFMYILIAAAVVWFYIKKQFKTQIFIGILAFLILVDMWTVNRRYLNDDNFESKRKVDNPFPMTVADQYIINDNPDGSRVLNLSVSPFNDASTSYYHNSIGGYHAAKMKKYQELIDFHIMPEIQRLSNTLSNAPTDSSISAAFANLPVLNMLDMEYLIYNPQAQPLKNPFALGKSWFVEDIKYVSTADDEIMALTGFRPQDVAIVREDFKNIIGDFVPKNDSMAIIYQTDYQPNHLSYLSKTSIEQMAVFSEIYYDKGWEAYINGEKTEIIKVNYLLRAIIVPPGENTIEFRFEPRSYQNGERIALVSSILMVLLLLFGGYWTFIRKKEVKKDEENV